MVVTEALTRLGAGFSSLETGNVFTVAYCDHCGVVQSVNDEDEPPKCEACNQQLTYYENDFHKISPGDAFDEKTERVRWYCPSCKTNNLHFEWAGLWD